MLLTVHLKLFHVNLVQIKLSLTISQKHVDVFPGPHPGIGTKASGQMGLELRLQGRWGRLGQEGVGVAPEEVGGEGQGQRARERDWRDLHVALGCGQNCGRQTLSRGQRI